MLQIEKLRDQLRHCNLVRPDTMWYCHYKCPCHFSCHCQYQNIHPQFPRRYWVEGNHTKLLQKPSHCTSMGPPSTTWQSLGFRNIPETAASTLWWDKPIKNMSKSTDQIVLHKLIIWVAREFWVWEEIKPIIGPEPNKICLSMDYHPFVSIN